MCSLYEKIKKYVKSCDRKILCLQAEHVLSREWVSIGVGCVSDRWCSAPFSCRGWVWSRRGLSPMNSGQSWTPSRGTLSDWLDTKETCCWSWEVCLENTRVIKSPFNNLPHNESAIVILFDWVRLCEHIYFYYGNTGFTNQYDFYVVFIRWW